MYTEVPSSHIRSWLIPNGTINENLKIGRRGKRNKKHKSQHMAFTHDFKMATWRILRLLKSTCGTFLELLNMEDSAIYYMISSMS